MAIKVLAFDLDDTLWDMRQTLLRAEKLLGEWLAKNCQGFSYDIKAIRQIREQVVIEQPSLAVNLSQLRVRVIQRALMASDYPEAQATAYAEEAFEIFFAARNQVIFFDGAIKSLEALSENYILGSLTNGNADIVKLGLSGFFSFTFSAADVGTPKPAPDLFETALKHTGVKPNEMIYIGDHPLHDIDAAKHLGINTIWVNLANREYTGNMHPDQQVVHLSHLPGAVSKIDVKSSPGRS